MHTDNILNRISKRAYKKNIPFNLNKEWLEEKLMSGKCEATGLQFKLYPYNNPFYPSVDRINSNKGYTKENCQLVVLGFNSLKSNFENKDLIEFCNNFVKIYEENNK